MRWRSTVAQTCTVHRGEASRGRGPGGGLLLGVGCRLQAQGRAGESAISHAPLGVAHPRGYAISRRDRLANTEILGDQRGLGSANIGLQAVGECEVRCCDRGLAGEVCDRGRDGVVPGNFLSLIMDGIFRLGR